MRISNLKESNNYNTYRKIVFIGVSIIIASVGLYFMISIIDDNNIEKYGLNNITVH
jgi:hypothetical protein